MTQFGTNFEKAVKDRDVPRLRSYLTSAIKLEPSNFQAGDYFQMRTYLEKEGIQFKESYNRLPDEGEEKPREQWDAGYFFQLVEWYRLNCADERLPLIEKVGRAVASAPKAMSVQKTRPAPKAVPDAQNTTFRPVPGERRNRASKNDRPNRWLQLIVAALLLAVLLAALLLLGKGSSSKRQESLAPPSQTEEINQEKNPARSQLEFI